MHQDCNQVPQVQGLTVLLITSLYLSRSPPQNEHQASHLWLDIGITALKNISNPRYTDDTTLTAERKTKEPLDEGERGEQQSWLKTPHSKHSDHGIRSHHFMANRRGKKWKQWQILFSSVPKSLQMVTAAMKLKYACSLEEKLRQT